MKIYFLILAILVVSGGISFATRRLLWGILISAIPAVGLHI